MATIKGVWVFNETPIFEVNGSEYYPWEFVNFTSNGTNFYGIGAVLDPIDYFQNADGTGYTSAYVATSTIYWADEVYRTVDFGTDDQTVSDDFYTWFTSNATMQEVIYRVKGSTLTAICDKIREKTGTTDKIVIEDIPALLDTI